MIHFMDYPIFQELLAYAEEQCPGIVSQFEPNANIEAKVASFSDGCQGSYMRELLAFSEKLSNSKFVGAAYYALFVLIGKYTSHK